jgi:hypothetical protein
MHLDGEEFVPMKRVLLSLIGATLMVIAPGCGGSEQPEPVKVKGSLMDRQPPGGDNSGGGAAPNGAAQAKKGGRLMKPK